MSRPPPAERHLRGVARLLRAGALDDDGLRVCTILREVGLALDLGAPSNEGD